jgi:hypothetical protein
MTVFAAETVARTDWGAVITSTTSAAVTAVGLVAAVFMMWMKLRLQMLELQRQGKTLMSVKEDTTANTEVTQATAEELHVAVANIQKIEIATNSMKDAIVLATSEAKMAQGRLKGQEDERARTGAKTTETGGNV